MSEKESQKAIRILEKIAAQTNRRKGANPRLVTQNPWTGEYRSPNHEKQNRR